MCKQFLFGGKRSGTSETLRKGPARKAVDTKAPWLNVAINSDKETEIGMQQLINGEPLSRAEVGPRRRTELADFSSKHD